MSNPETVTDGNFAHSHHIYWGIFTSQCKMNMWGASNTFQNRALCITHPRVMEHFVQSTLSWKSAEANGKKNIAVGVCPCYAVRRSKETTCRLMRESTCLHALITMHLSVEDFNSFTSFSDMKLLGQFSQTQQQQRQFCSSVIWSLKRWLKKKKRKTLWSTFVGLDFETHYQK